ncbi:general negative regulator of transcription subunit 4 [[Candida] jaroonii]|uniref:General negative regulator of transcription subunit 4 n=1 Tax=[Candida] jaroonii TaxID=467808 RepID=A0ACA9YAM7_9ASCO|nr:general negative regulator of transcription subunit 4 [[Candida] jaroonii]
MSMIDDNLLSDEEEELCPLCVEEMDISDKNFKPCPCGYQICQFCYNNIKQSPELNGRCPGCRRLYDDSTVEYKTISPEEYKIQQLKREKRERERKQREKEKKENDLANKKHLSGIRVVQKNLVYVTGLNPPPNNGVEDLTNILKSERFFGRYGKISKIVINNKKSLPITNPHHSNPGIVVYVTYVKKEDALKCINDMDGSILEGRMLRAAHGTTKYCSSYLRGHPCHNPNCMFLHEPGEEADSFTRKDLSTQQGIKMMNKARDEEGEIDNEGSRMSTPTIANSNISQIPTNASNTNLANISASASQTNLPAATSDSEEGPMFPTASWAKGSTTSPSVANVPLANSSAFPSLGEIKEKQVPKIIKKRKKDLIDESENDSDSAIQFLGEVTDNLTKLTIKKQDLVVKFKDSFNQEGTILPIFNFNSNLNRKFNNIEKDKISAKRIIDSILTKPIKNYHLAYNLHPIHQLQQHQQQQAQQAQQAQQQTQPPQPPQSQPQPQMAKPEQILLQQLQRQRDETVSQPSQPPASLPQLNSQQMNQPPGLGKPDSSSSQLLSQLMSGKR